MSYVCLWIRESSIVAARGAELAAALLDVVPRVAVDGRGALWADARGLPFDAHTTASRLLARLASLGVEDARAGVAAVPIAAELAARFSGDLVFERARVPLTVLAIDSTPGGSTEKESSAGGERAGEKYPISRGGRGAAEGFAADGSSPVNAESDSVEKNNNKKKHGNAQRSGSLLNIGSAASRSPREINASITVVPPKSEQTFLSSFPLLALQSADPQLLTLLDGVGIHTCGALAQLDREAVEVRFGAEAVGLWRLARADDPRRIFTSAPREQPHASIDFVDYVVTDPERLVFTVNALLGNVCDALRARGEHARRMQLTLPLANGSVWTRALRPARPTASRERWLRLTRAVLERLTVSDAVAGARLEVEATEPAGAMQGDLFDRGFATASAVEAALARLLEEQGTAVVEPDVGAHPLVERRAAWVPADREAGASRNAEAQRRSGAEKGLTNSKNKKTSNPDNAGASQTPRNSPRLRASAPPRENKTPAEPKPGHTHPKLTLQLLPEPRPLEVETVPRRDHEAPVRYHDGREYRQLVVAAGPDRVSGGQWEDAYAREYFRCVTSDGVLVWLFREARGGGWFLHGWWD